MQTQQRGLAQSKGPQLRRDEPSIDDILRGLKADGTERTYRTALGIIARKDATVTQIEQAREAARCLDCGKTYCKCPRR